MIVGEGSIWHDGAVGLSGDGEDDDRRLVLLEISEREDESDIPGKISYVS